MLHTKFRRNQSTGSGDEIEGFFTIYGRGGHLSYVTNIIFIKFHFISLFLKAYIQNVNKNLRKAFFAV